jgi:predicted aspartyl protease
MKKAIRLFCYVFCLVLFACGGNTQTKQAPVKLPSQGGKRSANSIIKVPYEERGKVKVIPVKLNGITMDMIFDTGCSGLHISLHELQTLHKNGQFSEADIIGSSYSQIADGTIVENGLIVLRSVEITDQLILENVEATVSLNQEAPLLLGNNVLDEYASIEIDNINGTLNFKKH